MDEQNLNANEKNPTTTTLDHEPEQYYRVAGFWIRTLAFFIDLGVIACLNGILFHILGPAQTSILPSTNLFVSMTCF
jgi:hypothetical protein